MNCKTSNDHSNLPAKLRECMQTGQRYLRITSSGYRAVFDRAFCNSGENGDQEAFIEQIESLMTEGHVLKNGNTCHVVKARWNGKDIVIKRYNNKGFFHSLRHTIKRSRARRCWLNAHRLTFLNIPTPQSLAYIEKRSGLLIVQSYIVTEYVAGKDIYNFLEDIKSSKQQYDATIQQIRDILQALKQNNICHGDMKYLNIMATQNGPTLIDLDAMVVFRSKYMFFFRRNKDHARLSRKIPI